MAKKFFFIAVLLFFCNYVCYSQNRNSIWCFGDSAGIDFSILTNPVTFPTVMDGRGSCVSISDTSGHLQFYAATILSIGNSWATVVFNRNHQVMLNGDSIIGLGWYHELIIIPDPANSNLYYLFSIAGIGSNVNKGLFYSVIDMTLDGGNGAVTTKNFQLQNFNMVDCLSAVKHGNGRDWWLIFRKSDYLIGGGNSDWYSYLISPAGITNFNQQTIGSINRTGLGQIDFSVTGSKLAFTCLTGVIEVFDFDRCTGLLSNPITIEQDPFVPPYPYYFGVSFSNDNSKLYVSLYNTTGYLFQFDLNSPNIASTKDTLWSASLPINVGKLKRMDDGKIYLSCSENYYPYPDSVRNFINENLSVINSPDSLGSLCDFQPFSFYLGGKRTYFGLPNNPDYELGALTGSICDSLTSVQEFSEQNLVNAFPNPVFNQIVVMSREKIKTITLTDVSGKICLVKEINSYPANGIVIDMEHFEKGIYLLKTKTEKGIEIKKLVKL